MADLFETAQWKDIIDWIAKAGIVNWLEMMSDEHASKEEFLKVLVKDREFLNDEFCRNIADTQIDMLGDYLQRSLEKKRNYYRRWVIEHYFKEQLEKGDTAAIAAIL
jgi:hypothetical protein